MRQHVGRPVSTWQVAEILNVAYGKAASVQNAVSGFRKAGLWPLTMDVFQDSDFAGSTSTDMVTETGQNQNPTLPAASTTETIAATGEMTCYCTNNILMCFFY